MRMKSALKSWLLKPQPRLRAGGLLVLLVASSFITPLSLDMYTPSIPHMADYFDTGTATVNLTLMGYYLFFAVGMLVFGPLSDKYGRKPLLVVGMVLYSIGSVSCALAPSIEALIAVRVVQALGAGSMSAVCTAVVKDTFEMERREKILALIQVLFVIGPIVAPMAGTAVLAVADWRGTFWVLTVVGVACLALSLLFSETLDGKDRYRDSLASTLGRLVVVARDPGFFVFLVVSSIFEIPYMAYVSVGSYIYIDFFGVGEVGYSLFFAAAAAVMAAGPAVWLSASKRGMTVRRVTTLLFVAVICAGAVMAVAGHLSPFLFCGCFAVLALAAASIRPYSLNILLEQQGRDAGTASALMNCMHAALGCIGMLLAMLPWSNFIVGVGVLAIVSVVGALVGWMALLRSRVPLACVKGDEPVSPL